MTGFPETVECFSIKYFSFVHLTQPHLHQIFEFETNINSSCFTSLHFPCTSCSIFFTSLFLVFFAKDRIIKKKKLLISELEEAGALFQRTERTSPLHLCRYEQVDGPQRSASAGTPRLHPQSFLQMRTVVSI